MTNTTRLQPGDQLPEFTLKNQDGNDFSPGQMRGKKFVLFVFPKAFTPGCTKEACDFRDSEARMTAAGFDVFGISADSPERLAKFQQQHDLPYTLLSDPEHEVQTALGAFGEKKNYGKVYLGTIRSTLIVDEEGKIIEALYNVKATGHVDRVLTKLGAK